MLLGVTCFGFNQGSPSALNYGIASVWLVLTLTPNTLTFCAKGFPWGSRHLSQLAK